MQFAILVSVIIAVLLGSFLTLTRTHQFFKVQSNLFLNAVDATNFGVNYALQSKHLFGDSITLKTNTTTTTTLKRKFWGGFLVIEAITEAKSKTFTKIALVGSKISNPATSLYISESKIPLVLVGDTKIEGTAYISDKGIKPGSISGHYYYGDQLVDGAIKYSSGRLPNLDSEFEKHIDDLLNYIPRQNDLVIPIEEENNNSFFNNIQFIYDNESLRLSEKYIGNIIIKSEKEIRVSKYAQLTDVTLVAPKIIIEKGFTGSGSFISGKQILVEEDVKLTYPSALVLQKKEIEPPSQKEEIAIEISENAFISGVVMFLESKNSTQSRTNTKIDVNISLSSIIEGQVYCSGNAQLSGTVIGSVYTKRFVTKGFGSIYVNHIYNGKILANDLHLKFSGLPFDISNNGIIKWLY